MAQFKIGDKVIVQANKLGRPPHYYPVGTVGVIERGPDRDGDYRVKGPADVVVTVAHARREWQYVHGSCLTLLQAPQDISKVVLRPLETAILSEFRRQGSKGLSAMDVMRALGVSGASFTARISTLRKLGVTITRSTHKDPITGRRYGRYILKETV